MIQVRSHLRAHYELGVVMLSCVLSGEFFTMLQINVKITKFKLTLFLHAHCDFSRHSNKDCNKMVNFCNFL